MGLSFEVCRRHIIQIHVCIKMADVETYIVKRDGSRELVDPNKITIRLNKLKNDVDAFLGRKLQVSVWRIAQQTIAQIYDGITSAELDEQSAYVSAYISDHPDYSEFAGQIMTSSLEKENRAYLSFISYAEKAYAFVDATTEQHSPLISATLLRTARKHGNLIDRKMVMERNYLYDYFAYQTLVKGRYLLSEYRQVIKNRVTSREMIPFETPQHMWMRVALGIHQNDLEAAFALYDEMSLKRGTMATPTLFNAGTMHSQLSSCFARGTIVQTSPAPMEIQYVKVGDMVHAKSGTLRQVVQVHVNSLDGRPMYWLETPYSAPIKVTGNHRIWSISKLLPEPSWMAVEAMTCDTYVRFTGLLSLKSGMVPRCEYGVKRVAGQVFVRASVTLCSAVAADEPVYTLGVEDEHSYTVGEGVVVQNCFLLASKGDSIEGIFDTLKECAQISKFAGGIGCHISDIRASGAFIKGTNGVSNGLVPMLRVYNNTARYVDQGGGRRKGSFALYLEPWHADIMAFLDLKRGIGAEADRARDLFYALWVPDLFWRRVKDSMSLAGPAANGGEVMWSLMSPDTCPGLSDCWGDEFDTLYTKYEQEKRYVRQIPVQEVCRAMITSMIESGVPYVLNKDHCNRKSNHQHLGTIKSSNLCTEIIEYSSKDETACCNLASISLNAFASEKGFDYDALYRTTRLFVRALDAVVDLNQYPLESAKRSNLKHRPVGLGIQGLADVFTSMRVAFDSPEAKQTNLFIAETMYFAALTESHLLACKLGKHESFPGSPLSRGVLQQDMWTGDLGSTELPMCGKGWDWTSLRAAIVKDGVRNSLLIAHMPTASTAQILGNIESFSPYTGVITVRAVKSGEFYVYCKPLIRDLIALGLWKVESNPATKKPYIPMKEKILACNGSIQSIAEIPQHIRDIYRTIDDISTKDLTLMARDRAVYIDQSQSLNVYYTQSPDLYSKIIRYLLFAWSLGLKTASYYTRVQQEMAVLKFSGSSAAAKKEEECVSCSA